MHKDIKLDFNIDKLKLIRKELRKKFLTKVGVLSGKTQRSVTKSNNKDVDNVSIGFKHEFGSASSGVPERSFLRMPLEEKLPEELNEIGDDVFKAVTEKNIENFFEKLGVKAEEIIQEAFNTGGFGKWSPLKERTIKKKGHDTILIDTTQLRKSVTSKVIKNDN